MNVESALERRVRASMHCTIIRPPPSLLTRLDGALGHQLRDRLVVALGVERLVDDRPRRHRRGRCRRHQRKRLLVAARVVVAHCFVLMVL